MFKVREDRLIRLKKIMFKVREDNFDNIRDDNV